MDGEEVVVAAPTDVRGPAFAVVHPHAVTLSRGRPDTSARNAWPGRVVDVDLEGDRARVRVAGPVDLVAEVTIGAVGELGLAPGKDVWTSVKATEVAVYPA
jgi:molybdate transport system ATP-binding protein